MHFRAAKSDCVFKGDYLLTDDEVLQKSLASIFVQFLFIKFGFNCFIFLIT